MLVPAGPLNFPPTYQHIPGAGDRFLLQSVLHILGPEGMPPDPETSLRAYDPKKGRVPSWTDRVLWQSFPDVDAWFEQS